jgi:hypothetical protein
MVEVYAGGCVVTFVLKACVSRFVLEKRGFIGKNASFHPDPGATDCLQMTQSKSKQTPVLARVSASFQPLQRNRGVQKTRHTLHFRGFVRQTQALSANLETPAKSLKWRADCCF